MIVDDEQRNDSLLGSMIRRGGSAYRVTVGGLCTQLQRWLPVLRGLIHNGREGWRRLRHLARQEPTLYGGLYPLLLEANCPADLKSMRLS